MQGFPFRRVFLLLVTSFMMLFVNGQGFLKTAGKYIVNESGGKVLLRGMGLGGWMLQEGYMFRLGNIGRQYLIRQKIEELVGAEKTKIFYDQWLASHTTKKDIDSLAAWGFNSIRLPMHYNLYTLPVDKEPVAGKNTWLEKGFVITDSLLSWCRQNKMYLILDLHATPGGQGNDLPISDRDPLKPSLWESDANQAKMIALWKKLATRYASEEWIGGYDIINEPNWGFEDPKDTRGTAEKTNLPLRRLMMDITSAIREVDKRHIIIIEGNGFGNNYNGILPAWDDNLVMSFHKYGNFNTEGAIKRFLELREQYQVPLWLGESGENFNTWFTEAIRLVENQGIGWAWWQSKKMGINNPMEIKQPEGYQQLVDYFTGKTTIKPTAEQAWKILTVLLENIKIENNLIHPDVMDAMFRQVHGSGTKPFKRMIIDHANSVIPAVDFDMGSQRVAYYDKDSARYQYTPGVNTTGNRGSMYRNDGVDIQKDADGYYVNHTEAGEWMQYTINIAEPGTYAVAYTVATDAAGTSLSLTTKEHTRILQTRLPDTGGLEKWQTISAGEKYFKKGAYCFCVFFDTGSINLRSIQFNKQKK